MRLIHSHISVPYWTNVPSPHPSFLMFSSPLPLSLSLSLSPAKLNCATISGLTIFESVLASLKKPKKIIKAHIKFLQRTEKEINK